MVMLQKSRALGKSLTYIINISGPRIDLCATPTDTATLSDWALPQQVTWLLLDKKESNQFRALSSTLKLVSLRDRMERFTVSKALVKSENTTPVVEPLSIPGSNWSINWAEAVTVDNFGLKPNYFEEIKWSSVRYPWNWVWTALSMIVLKVGKIEIGPL